MKQITRPFFARPRPTDRHDLMSSDAATLQKFFPILPQARSPALGRAQNMPAEGPPSRTTTIAPSLPATLAGLRAP